MSRARTPGAVLVAGGGGLAIRSGCADLANDEYDVDSIAANVEDVTDDGKRFELAAADPHILVTFEVGSRTAPVVRA